MNPKKEKIFKYIAIACVILSTLVAIISYNLWKFQKRENDVNWSRVSPISLSYPADFSRDDILVGASQNVFVGKVLTQTGNKKTEVGPRTQYQVEVISNIKGELDNTITLDMLGGYDEGGHLFVVDEYKPEDFLLRPGTTYLLATRYNKDEDWYTLIPHPNARKVISLDVVADKNNLPALVSQDEKVKTFEEVFSHEILLDADVFHKNTHNSFESLPPEKKAAAQARANEARTELEAAKAQKGVSQ